MVTIFTPVTAEPVKLPRLFILGPGEENFNKAPETPPELQWFARSVGLAKEQGTTLATCACFAINGFPLSEVVVDEATEWGKFIAEYIRTQNRMRTPRLRIVDPAVMSVQSKPPLKEQKFRCPEISFASSEIYPGHPRYEEWRRDVTEEYAIKALADTLDVIAIMEDTDVLLETWANIEAFLCYAVEKGVKLIRVRPSRFACHHYKALLPEAEDIHENPYRTVRQQIRRVLAEVAKSKKLNKKG
jgi:hypothetical protein